MLYEKYDSTSTTTATSPKRRMGLLCLGYKHIKCKAPFRNVWGFLFLGVLQMVILPCLGSTGSLVRIQPPRRHSFDSVFYREIKTYCDKQGETCILPFGIKVLHQTLILRIVVRFHEGQQHGVITLMVMRAACEAVGIGSIPI